MEIPLKQCPAGYRIRHDSVPAAFGVLCTNAKEAMGWINVIGTQSAKFLSPQSRIVGKCEHHTVANRLLARSCENRLPVQFVWNPRQMPIAPDENLPAIRCDGVLGTETFIDEVAVEKPEYGYPLLNGCIRDCPGLPISW